VSEAAAAPAEPEVQTPPEPGSNVTATEIMKRVADEGGVAIVPRGIAEILSDDEIRRVWRTGAALAASGMWSGTGSKITPAEAFAKILIGRDLGLSPTRALMTIDVVKGSIQLRGVLLAAWLREHPTYDYALSDHDETKCTCTIRRKTDGEWRDEGAWTFTVEDAKTAGLVKSDGAWTTYPKSMVMWRAIAAATRAYAPDVFGGAPVYVEGEVPREPALTAGVGDGEARNIDLGPKVEAVLARAAEAGHAALADRATAEMVLSGQPPEVVERWVTEATKALDEIEPVADAEVVDAEPVAADAEAESIKTEADAISAPEQSDLGI
jgi:hypothetical protein